MADLLQGKMMEVKGADYRLAKKVVQEGVGCLEVMVALRHEMAEILETVRMAEQVEMADWHQTKMMEAKSADHHLAKRAVLVHS